MQAFVHNIIAKHKITFISSFFKVYITLKTAYLWKI